MAVVVVVAVGGGCGGGGNDSGYSIDLYKHLLLILVAIYYNFK